MSKEISAPEEVIDKEKFERYAMGNLITPELFYVEEMIQGEYTKMTPAEKMEFHEGVKAAKAYQKATGSCVPWEQICGEAIHKRYRCILTELVCQIMESGSTPQVMVGKGGVTM